MKRYKIFPQFAKQPVISLTNHGPYGMIKSGERMVREALRYLQNVRETLSKSPVEDNIYPDVKPVREAFGTAYLAMLEAINEALLKKGLTKKELPKSVDAYRKALKKYFGVYNGKLLREFESLYALLHIAGYYRGLLYRTSVVKDALKDTEEFIKKMSKGRGKHV